MKKMIPLFALILSIASLKAQKISGFFPKNTEQEL